MIQRELGKDGACVGDSGLPERSVGDGCCGGYSPRKQMIQRELGKDGACVGEEHLRVLPVRA